MDGGVVKHLAALRHAKEARALLECLGAELRHLVYLAAARESAVFLAVCDDVLCRGLRQAGHALKKRRRGSVYIHADGVHAVLDYTAKRFVQARLRQVVLVLPHAYAFGVYFYKL